MILKNETSSHLVLMGGFENKIWVYGVYDGDKLVFMWYDKLADIISMKSLRKASLFNSNKPYTFALLSGHNNRIEAENSLVVWLNKSELEGRTPEYNLHFRNYKNNLRIVCLQTGDIFNTSAEACKLLGLSTIALCNHLARRAGFRSVKGLIFEYIDAPFNVKNVKELHNNTTELIPPVDTSESITKIFRQPK